MEHTKENAIKVLKAIENNLKQLALSYENEQNEVKAKIYWAQASEVYNAYMLLENQEYFDSIYDIYKNDIEEDQHNG